MDYRALAEMELTALPSPEVQHEFRIFIEEKPFDRICATADTVREVGGILVGEALRDEGGPYIRVDAIIEALHAEESGTELTITHATWNHIHQQMDTVHAGKRIVGWYHTHPNFGIFLSERDRFIQQSFFDMPFQIALVYDPVRREHGIFTWRENKPWRIRQYWIGVQQHVWDGVRDAPDAPGPKRPAQTGTRAQDAAAPAPDAAIDDSTPQTLADFLGSPWMMAALLVGVLFGFGLGATWMRRGAAADPAPGVQTAQDAVASLNSDLIAVIRGSLSDEAFAKTFDEGIARLDHASEALKPLDFSDPSVKAAVQSVADAQQSLSRARHDRLVAHEMLQQIEQVIRRNHTPASVERDLEEQRVALAGLYFELAREAALKKDGARADEMLKKAISIDPVNQARYEQQFKSFEEQGTAPQPPGPSAGDGKKHDAPIAPPGSGR